MGDRFTSADILLTTSLEWAIAYGVGICDNAQPYLERIKKREAFQRAIAANAPLAQLAQLEVCFCVFASSAASQIKQLDRA